MAAAEILADQSFNFAAHGDLALHAITSIARCSTALVIEFSDIADAADTILEVAANHVMPQRCDPPALTRDGVTFELCGGEALAWDSRAEELHHLSPAATAIWRACEDSDDPHVVAAVVANGSPTPPVVADVRTCIEELHAKRLLPVRPSGRSSMAM